ncbi:MFS transporter [Streptomyces gamaensis]|uniref:MFS transporter n=1 Tax=Streptomyces gamaensis TaxID=1763542 RepID=A0ABW0YXA0_9ACTN
MGGSTLDAILDRGDGPSHLPEPAPGTGESGEPWPDGPGEEETVPGDERHEDADPEQVPLSPARVRCVFTGLLLALLLGALDQTVIATALPRIAGELHGLPRMSWAVTAYLLASATVLPVLGKLGDRLGRKPVFLFAIGVFVLGSALASRAHTMDQLIAHRALQGVGGGGLVIGVQAIIADIVPARQRGRYLGAVGAVFGIASVAGPLLGGYLTDHATWRWCFTLNLPLGALAFAVVALGLRRTRPEPHGHFDTFGAALLMAFSICLILLVSWGGTVHPWRSHLIVGLAAGALGTALLFVAVEHVVTDPVIPPYLLRDPVFAVSALIGTTVGAGLSAAASYLPTYLQMAGGADATTCGLLMLPMMGAVVLASVVTGQLVSRTGRYKIFPIAGGALATTGTCLLSRLDTDTPRALTGLWTAVLGLGIGLTLPVLVLAVQNSVHPAELSTATSANNYFRQLGGCLGAAVYGTLLAHRLTTGLARELPAADGPPRPDSLTPRLLRALPEALREAYERAYADAMPRIFLYLVPVLALGFLLAFLLKEKPLVSHNASEAPVIPSARPAPPDTATPVLAGVPVTGTVHHHDGSTVPHAALTLIDVRGTQIGRGASDEGGRYALSTPGTGSYVLIAAAGGHQPQAVTVTVGERPVELDVVLGGAGRLAGSVLTADGNPVRDALVTLTDVHGEVVASTRTGREGGYVIGELVAGEYTLASSAPGFRPAALPVSVHSSRETRQDIELAGGAVLRGIVRGGGGRPVEDARVTLLDAAGSVVDSVTTGADGAFRFIDLSAGEYTVIAAGYPPVATVLRVAGGGRTERDLQLGHADRPEEP